MALNRRERILAAATLLALGVFLGDRFVLSPALAMWKDRRTRIADLTKSLGEAALVTGREEELKKRWAEMERRALPSDPTAAESAVMAAVVRWARSSGLTVTAIKPRWSEPGPARRGARTSNVPEPRVEFRLSGKGSLAEIARFLQSLERDPLALRLEDVDIVSRDDRGRELTLGARFTGIALTGDES